MTSAKPTKLTPGMLVALGALCRGEDMWSALRKAGHNASVTTLNALRRRKLVSGSGIHLTAAGRRVACAGVEAPPSTAAPKPVLPPKQRQQLPLFEMPVPSNGVRTSDEAAEAIERDTSRLRRLVFRLIEQHGGLTCQEVERMTGICHETISARIWELHTRGWIVDSGKMRRTEARRRAIVWAVLAQPKENAGGEEDLSDTKEKTK